MELLRWGRSWTKAKSLSSTSSNHHIYITMIKLHSDEIELFMKISKASFDALNSSSLSICFHQVSSLGDEKEKKTAKTHLKFIMRESEMMQSLRQTLKFMNEKIMKKENAPSLETEKSHSNNSHSHSTSHPHVCKTTWMIWAGNLNNVTILTERSTKANKKEWKNQEREISKNLENQTHWMKIYSFLSQTQISRQHVVVTHKPATYGANRQLRLSLSLRGAGRNEWRRKSTKNAHSYHFLPIDGKQQRQKRIVFIYFFLSVFFFFFSLLL